MATRKASEGIRLLRRKTAGPRVKDTCVVDQVYAHYQHEDLSLRHLSGGRGKYLEGPLFEGHRRHIGEFARGLLRVEGTGKTAASRWADMGRYLVRGVRDNAPDEYGILRDSAAYTATEGRRVIVDEPARERRRSDPELQALDESAVPKRRR